MRAAFHYVRTGVTVVPEALPKPDELAALAGRIVAALGVAPDLQRRGNHWYLQR